MFSFHGPITPPPPLHSLILQSILHHLNYGVPSPGLRPPIVPGPPVYQPPLHPGPLSGGYAPQDQPAQHAPTQTVAPSPGYVPSPQAPPPAAGGGYGPPRVPVPLHRLISSLL